MYLQILRASLAVGAVLALLVTLPPAAPQASAAQELSDLIGNWRGWGWVNLHNGGRERVRCRVSYSALGGGDGLNQNLRCASTTYKINATSQVRRSGSRLSGSWTETSYNVSGSLTGEVLDDGFSLRLTGDVFSAGMSVQVAQCNQNLSISVSGIEIRSVEMGLRKC